MRFNQLFTTLLLLMGSLSLYAQDTIVVNPGDDLNAILQSSPPGKVYLVQPGDYERIKLQNVSGTAAQPIVVMGASPTEESRLVGQYTPTFECRWGCEGDGRAATLRTCQYMVFENIHFTGGTEGVMIRGSHHLIFKDCKVSDIGNTGVKMRHEDENILTHHIDWIGGEVFDIGKNQDGAYSEQFYIGQAQQAHDESHDIWIENVYIHDNHGGESIDIKPEAYNITVRGCRIENNEIYAYKNPDDPNDPRNEINRGAIQVVAGGPNTGGNPPNDETRRAHNVWIENNTINNITNKSFNNDPAADGIFLYNRPAVFIKGNTISNVETNGFRAFGEDADYQTMIDASAPDRITNVGDEKMNYGSSQFINLVEDVGENPMTPQSWYGDTSNVEQKYPRIYTFSAQQAGNEAIGLIDSSIVEDDRWSARDFPQFVIIDYGSTQQFIGSRMHTFMGRAYQFTISVADEPEGDYTTIVNRSDNTDGSQPISDDFAAASGRYVKLEVTALFDSPSSWVSIVELEMLLGSTATSAQNAAVLQMLEFYPNPATNVLVLEAEQDLNYWLSDASGRKVLSGHAPKGVRQLSVSELPRGLYFLNYQTANLRIVAKKVIIR